jgi:Zn-dependent M28 family amino/carboxypeptidase
MLVANVNLDMVGRNAADSLIAVGQEYTSIGLLAHAVARARPELRLTIAPDPWPEDQLFFRSDHFNFARIGVPAIFFTTGMHADYHRQTDEVNGIDMDKVTRVGRFVFHLVNEIANAPGAPAWTERGIADLKAMGGRWFPPDD